MLASIENEIAEVSMLYRAGVLTLREFYLRLRRLGLDEHAANRRRRALQDFTLDQTNGE